MDRDARLPVQHVLNKAFIGFKEEQGHLAISSSSILRVICRCVSLLSGKKYTISSIRFKNSGLKVAFTKSSIFDV